MSYTKRINPHSEHLFYRLFRSLQVHNGLISTATAADHPNNWTAESALQSAAVQAALFHF